MLCANACTYRSVLGSVCTVRAPLFSGRFGRVENPVRLYYSTCMELRVCGTWARHTRQMAKKLLPFPRPLHSLVAAVHLDSPHRCLVSHGTEASPSPVLDAPLSPSTLQHPHPLTTSQKDGDLTSPRPSRLLGPVQHFRLEVFKVSTVICWYST